MRCFTTGCASKDIDLADAAFAATGTSLTGVGGVDVFDRETPALGLVGEKILQLAKRPTGDHPVEVWVPNLRSLADAHELFHADAAAVCIKGLVNDSFAQDVVFVADSPLLMPRQAAQDTLRSGGSLALQTGADTHPLFLELLAFFPAMQRSKRRGGGVTDAEINAEGGAGTRCFVGVLDDNVDEPPLVFVNDCRRRRLLPGQGAPLVFAKHKRNMDAPADRGKTDRLFPFAVVKNLGIVVNACGPEQAGFAPPFLGGKQGRRNASHGADGKVGRQAITFPNDPIGQMVQPVLVADVELQRGVAGGGKSLARGGEGLSHRLCRSHLADYRSLAHRDYCRGGERKCQEKR